ncbi:MAG: serine hydroxymethyltransferase [Candidatus Kerfeldbacteria bacterium]
MIDYSNIKKNDPEVAETLSNELNRQQNTLEMIASENFASEAVMEAIGSVATNKYAEGYPGKRYYGGNEFIDALEQMAIDRAKELFAAEHVNVQPLSGSPANLAVYAALLKPGDTVLGMALSYGGHLTHGHPVTFSASIYNFEHYTCDPETGAFDYEAIRKQAQEVKPKILLAGYSSYSRDLDYEKLQEIAEEVGAVSMMDMAHIAGLVAGGVMKNPVPIMDVVTTTTHKSLRGPRGAMILCKEKFAKQIDKAVFPGLQGGPHENVIAALAVALKEAAQPEFKDYAQQIVKNAAALFESLLNGGLKIVFGGTENHIVLTDVTSLGLTGKQAEELLDEVGITVNKNVIPDDERPPTDPSGIRFGTPALTTRGMKENQMTQIGDMIIELLKNPEDDNVKQKARTLVSELTKAFPLYG